MPPTGFDTAPASPLAEAEVKLEITVSEADALPAMLADLGFLRARTTGLTDHYIAVERSPTGGWAFTRLRASGDGVLLLTRKHWVTDSAGRSVRVEEERHISATDFASMLDASEPISLAKTRTEYQGTVGSLVAEVVLDRLSVPGGERHFIECEVMCDPERAVAVRALLHTWLHATLGLAPRPEAPTMLEIALGCRLLPPGA